MKQPNSTKPNAFIVIAQVSLLFYVLVFLAGCNPGNKDSFAYDWKDISIDGNTDLTRIQMLNENFGFVGGCPKIDSFIYESGYDVRVGGINYDTLLFQTDDEPLVYYHLIRTVPALPERCLYKTENGGLSWMSVQTPFISGIVDFRFINESVGFVLTLKEGVYKTVNGGMDWLKIVPEAFTTGYGVTYQNPFDAIGAQSTNHIYLLDREQNLIIESLNGGTSWQCISKGTPQLAYTFYLPEKCYFKTDSDTGTLELQMDCTGLLTRVKAGNRFRQTLG
ncbi:MAG: WD40/YVTN/BNR-like repeat-containing protein [Salinivirgaceae bacterium]